MNEVSARMNPKTSSLFSQRTNWQRQTNRITQVHQELKQQNVDIIDLTLSNPTRCEFPSMPPELLGALADTSSLDYIAEAKGLEKARQAVAGVLEKRDTSIAIDNLFLTASTSEAYAYIFRLLADQGDTILFPTPSYPLFHFLGELSDVELGFYPLQYDGSWSINMAELVEALHPRVKAFVTVNPNNPTGSYIQSDELEHLSKMAADRGMAIISDEVFYDFALQDNPRRSLLGNENALTFTLGGFSKYLGLPQMKLAWIYVSGPNHLVTEACQRLEIIADTYLSVNTPIQHAAPVWLQQSHFFQDPIIERIRENWSFLQKETAELTQVEVLTAQGGWYAILKVNPNRTEEEWVLKLLSKYHVFLHPGYFYDLEDGPHLVVSLIVPRDQFKEGIQRVVSRVEQQAS